MEIGEKRGQKLVRFVLSKRLNIHTKHFVLRTRIENSEQINSLSRKKPEQSISSKIPLGKKISKNSTGRTHSVETREKMSSKKREDVKNNPEKYRGRYNRGYVKKFVCTNGFTVLGTWERDFVEFCLLNDIKIEQPKTGFSYVYETVERTYFPDFFLPESDEYIEIKGFKVAKDEAKWDYLRNVHKKRLIVLGGPPSWILTNDRSFMRRLL